MTTMNLVTHAIAFLIGGGAGWYLYSKFGAKVTAAEAALKKV